MKQPGSALFRRAAVLTALASLGLLLPGCPPPSSSDKSTLTISANPTSVAGDGTTTIAISVSGTDTKGKPLAADLLLTTTKGTFPTGSKSVSAKITGGSYQTALTSCDSTTDTSCAGSGKVTAASGALTASVTVSFTQVCKPTGPGAEGSVAGDCYDGVDNDCNGTIDDADPGCLGKACDAKNDVWTQDPSSGGVVCSCPNSGKAENTIAGGCYDGIDNDCNGVSDGQDPNCLNQVCDAQGDQWNTNGGTLQCSCVKTPGQTGKETSCDDGLDNDCDGLVDCADPDCASIGCTDTSRAPNDQGLTCDATAGVCACAGDPGNTGVEADCSNGLDDDCDGNIDCGDTDCRGQTCGPNGMICDPQCGTTGHPACDQNTSCICSGGQTNETSCDDGIDNDCDGLVDCADTDCNGKICGANGMACANGACACPGGQTVETTCGDGIDNDCNGKTDCQDPACDTLACGTGKICDFSTGTCVTDPGTDRLLFTGDKTTVLAESTSEIVLTAQVSNNTGPRAGVNVTFTVPSPGQLTESGTTVYIGTTDASGTAQAHWRPGSTPGKDVTATASINTSGTVTKSFAVQVIGLASVAVGSVEYTEMGINDATQWQTQNSIQFKLLGTDGVSNKIALPDGVPVAFTVSDASITLNVTSATTVGGTVTVIATSGLSETQFKVTGTATIGTTTLSAATADIPVVGRTPAIITISCPTVNLGGLVSNDGTYSNFDSPVTCQVSLVNRFNHPVPVPTQVTIEAEAGSVTSPVTTTGTTGVATFVFNPKGGYLPQDVPPIAGEPSYTDGTGRVHNPRDGLVTIIAFTDGEEHFTDGNGNGVIDPGEGYVDLGEPYIDANDNSQHDAGETIVDTNNNNTWDGPNGVWDGSTKIWTETRIVETGNPSAAAGTGFTPATGVSILAGGSVDVSLLFADENMNPVRSGTTVKLTKGTGNKVTQTFVPSGTSVSIPDALGATWARIEDCGGSVCDCRFSVCTARTTIGGFTGGDSYTVHIADASSATDPAGAPFTVTASYSGCGSTTPCPVSVTGTTNN